MQLKLSSALIPNPLSSWHASARSCNGRRCTAPQRAQLLHHVRYDYALLMSPKSKIAMGILSDIPGPVRSVVTAGNNHQLAMFTTHRRVSHFISIILDERTVHM